MNLWWRIKAKWLQWRLRKPLRERTRLIEKKMGLSKGSVSMSIDEQKVALKMKQKRLGKYGDE